SISSAAQKLWISDRRFASSGMTELSAFPPPPNFLHDDAVVALGLAGAHAGLEHVAMHLEHRQFLPELLALVEHHVHVLECLLDAALRREIPRPPFFTLGLH